MHSQIDADCYLLLQFEFKEEALARLWFPPHTIHPEDKGLPRSFFPQSMVINSGKDLSAPNDSQTEVLTMKK